MNPQTGPVVARTPSALVIRRLEEAEAALRGRRFEQAEDLVAQIASDASLSASTSERLAQLRLRLARALSDAHWYRRSLSQVAQLPPPLRTHSETAKMEVKLLTAMGQHEQALDLLAARVAQHPDDAQLKTDLGRTLASIGRVAEAEAAFRSAVELRPEKGEAWRGLVDLGAAGPGDLDRMRSQLSKPSGDFDRMLLHFALGLALERTDPQLAFGQYAAGNDIQRRLARYQPEALTRMVDEVVRGLDREDFPPRPQPMPDGPCPIFVVGMPRSGSTLVEQILSSHPDVEALGELQVMHQIMSELTSEARANALDRTSYVKTLGDEARAQLGRRYIERAQDFRRTERRHFVDKSPANYLHVGIIRAILPQARIIDVRRHPMACGFGIYKQPFATVKFSSDLTHIGLTYRDYVRAMRHFDAILPGVVHRVILDDLVADPQSEIERMLEYIGIPVHPDCLEFHRTERAIATPSAQQVRRPIEARSAETWRTFEPWLDDLKVALGDTLRDWKG